MIARKYVEFMSKNGAYWVRFIPGADVAHDLYEVRPDFGDECGLTAYQIDMMWGAPESYLIGADDEEAIWQEVLDRNQDAAHDRKKEASWDRFERSAYKRGEVA